MKKLCMPLLALLLAPLAAQAQIVRGVVVEDGGTAPIAGASVELFGVDGGRVAVVQTDARGAFLLRPRRAGDFFVHLTHIAYTSVRSDTLRVANDESLRLELRMSRTAIPVEPLVVTARGSVRLEGFHERQRRGGFGRFLTRADIERRPGSARATELIEAMPGVEIVRANLTFGGPRTNLITMRGGLGRCLPTIYIDGVPFQQFPESGVDDFLSADMLEGVEVYTSFAGAPSPIHATGNCGVVAFWSRPNVGGARWSWRRFATGIGLFGALLLLTR